MQLLKSYQLVRKIAAGGMAEVFLARTEGPRGFSKTLVLKRILPHLAEDEQFVEMFLSEARLVAQLNHPHVVQIFDFGEFEGSFYIAMEYIDGPNLRVLSRQAASQGVELAPALCAKMISYACEGLAYAHEFVDPQTCKPLGLVHRDVSSDNLLISRNGALKVVDFGIAKVVGQGPRTKVGTIKGKLPYMPPEQIRGKPLDKRVDVFALGVVLYELLARKRPFDAKGEAAIMNAILYQTMKPIRQCRPDVPQELADIIERCLAKNRDERYANCRQLRGDLERFILHCGKPVGTEELASLVAKLVPRESDSASVAGPASAMRVPAPVARSSMTPSSGRRLAPATEPSGMSLVAPAAEEAAPPVIPPRLTPVFTTARSQPVPIESLELGLAPTTSRQTMRPVRERTGLIVALLGCLAGLAVVALFFVTRSYAPQLRREEPPPAVELPREAEPEVQPEPQPEASPEPQPEAQREPQPETPLAPQPEAPPAPQPEAPPAPQPEPVNQDASATEPEAAPAEEAAPRTPKGEGMKRRRVLVAERSASPPDESEELPAVESEEPARPAEAPTPPESVAPQPASPAPPELATVVFESSPPAQIRINGQFAGFSPVSQCHLPPGPVQVEMYDSVKGFSKRETFVLRPGDNGVHQLSVEKGSLELHIQPFASVRVDGKPMGQTPLAPISLYEGQHELRLENPELGKAVVKTITIRPKETLTFQYDWSSSP